MFLCKRKYFMVLHIWIKLVQLLDSCSFLNYVWIYLKCISCPFSGKPWLVFYYHGSFRYSNVDIIDWVICLRELRKRTRFKSPEVFNKKGFLKNFSKFTAKHLYQSLFFNKVTGLRPATLFKKDCGAGFSLWILRNF